MTEFYNPWLQPSLDAHLKHDRLQLDPGSAEAGAKYAAEAINALNAARGYCYLLDQYTGFSDNGVLQSALNLRDRFAKEGGRVGKIIDDYIKMLNSMGDTFVAAGKTYRQSDDQSKSDFDTIKTQAVVSMNFGVIPRDGDTPLSSWSDHSAPDPSDANGMGDMARVHNAKSGRYTDAIGSEDPGHHDGKWFFDVGQGINPIHIADKSALWKWIAQVIAGSFDTLSGLVKRLESDGHWTGHGVKGAIAACTEFEGQAKAFATDLYAIAENLLYTATWLSQTKAGMPLRWEEDFRGTSTEKYIITTGSAAFTAWYNPGIGNSGTSIPILMDPTDPSAGAQPDNPRSDYGGTRPNTRNGGGPHGNVSPTGPGGTGNPNGKTPGKDPKGTHDPKDKDPNGKDHKDPNGKDHKDPNGKDHDGKDPNGNKHDPNGKSPNGDSSDGSNDGTGQNPGSSSNSGQNSGLSGLQSALQSLTGANTQNTDQKKQQDLKDMLKDSPLTNLLDDLKKSPGGGGPGGGGPGGSPTKLEPANARLFPRAAVAADALEATVTGSVARAGIASGSGAGGMGGGGMGGMGHGGGGHGAQGGKEHRRPEFLDSNEHLDEAMGAPPIVAKPVVEG